MIKADYECIHFVINHCYEMRVIMTLLEMCRIAHQWIGIPQNNSSTHPDPSIKILQVMVMFGSLQKLFFVEENSNSSQKYQYFLEYSVKSHFLCRQMIALDFRALGIKQFLRNYTAFVSKTKMTAAVFMI